MFNCKSYCKNYSRKNIECVVCMEQVIFKIKKCYQPWEEK